jgi:hypothetical protein
MDHRNWTSFSEHQTPRAAYPPEREPRRGGLERNRNLVLARMKFFESFHATFYTRVCCGTPNKEPVFLQFRLFHTAWLTRITGRSASQDGRRPLHLPRIARFVKMNSATKVMAATEKIKSNGSVAGLVGMNQYRLYWLVWT